MVRDDRRKEMWWGERPRDIIRHLLGMWYVFSTFSFHFYIAKKISRYRTLIFQQLPPVTWRQQQQKEAQDTDVSRALSFFFCFLFLNPTNHYLQINHHNHLLWWQQMATSTCPSRDQDEENKDSEEVDDDEPQVCFLRYMHIYSTKYCN